MHIICISNLGSRVTHDSLAAVFSTYGSVHASVVFDKTLPEEKRKAFLTMPNEQEASLAIKQLNGCIIDGHQIQVNKSAQDFIFP